MSTQGSAGVSEVYAEEGELWLRVSPGHAVSERWLQDRAPDLYAEWWAAPGAGARDRLALQIEQRLDELESSGSWREAVTRSQEQARPSAVADKVAQDEGAAERLGAITLDDPGRAAAHRAHQVAGDEVRELVAATPAGQDRELLERRLDAADLVADRPFIEAVSGLTVEVDRLAAAALTDACAQATTNVSPDVIRAELAAEDPHAALRADVLSREIELHGVDLARMAPGRAPASDFYARHTPAIEARLDREITAGGFRDLPSYVASWQVGRPATASLHDTEQALVEQVVGDVITAVDAGGRDVREAHRMWERAADRAAIREWSAALERGDLELGVEQLRGPEQQLELGLHVDVEHDVDAGHDAEQEVG